MIHEYCPRLLRSVAAVNTYRWYLAYHDMIAHVAPRARTVGPAMAMKQCSADSRCNLPVLFPSTPESAGRGFQPMHIRLSISSTPGPFLHFLD
ncbi:hypothetical protein PGTUg99_007119 [Puccinia graminis f. sp. tritici]|nr:hypothetical protein PGTUg99_007119 [Puccinia graminis f. sp. tritici]